MKKYQLYFLSILLLWSCKKETDEIIKIVTYDEPIPVELLATDAEIVNKTYDVSYFFPADFTYEKYSEGSLYYENTVSTRTNEAVSIELHTNDKAQARAWSETSSKRSSYYRDLVSERETEKYFEFKRVYARYPTDVLLSRVHKSSYFVPLLDKSKRNKEIGTLKKRPITKEASKLFIEYWWSVQNAGWAGKVLETKLIELPNSFQYNLKTFSSILGDIGTKAKIEVWDNNYVVNKQSGEVFAYATKIKTLEGK